MLSSTHLNLNKTHRHLKSLSLSLAIFPAGFSLLSFSFPLRFMSLFYVLFFIIIVIDVAFFYVLLS